MGTKLGTRRYIAGSATMPCLISITLPVAHHNIGLVTSLGLFFLLLSRSYAHSPQAENPISTVDGLNDHAFRRKGMSFLQYENKNLDFWITLPPKRVSLHPEQNFSSLSDQTDIIP
jgi:hypothetical protein